MKAPSTSSTEEDNNGMDLAAIKNIRIPGSVKQSTPSRTDQPEQPGAQSPELPYEASRRSPRAFVVPDVPPRAIPSATLDPVAAAYHVREVMERSDTAKIVMPRPPHSASIPALDPIAAAYQAGKADAEAERLANENQFTRPLERPIISYGQISEPRPLDPLDTRLRDNIYVDELDFLRRRGRDVEAIIDGRLDGQGKERQPFYIDDEGDFNYERRPDPIVWNNRQPFAPTTLPRRYPRDTSPW